MAKGSRQQHKEPTKKQIAVSRREKQQQRTALIGVGVVAALVLGIASAGLIDQLVVKPSRPVAIVNDVRIRADDYQGRVRYERFTLDTFLQNLEAQLQLLDPEDPTSNFLTQYYQQIAGQARQQRLSVDRQTVDSMIEEELARQKVAELGLSVSQDEVNEAIRARIASMAGFWTETQATAVASTVVAVTATAESFTPTPVPTPTPTLTATLVTTATPELPTPAPTPTRHIITDEEFNQDYANYLNVLKEQASFGEAELRRVVEAGLLVDKLREYFVDQTPTEAEQVNVSHIQVDTQEQAQVALKRLDAGEDFALVASQVSTDTFTAADGGELGWFPEGELAARYGPALEETAFSLQPGEYSQPITTTLGFHIVKVNERAVHPLEEYQLQARQEQAYSDWLEQARSAEGVEDLWQPEMAPPDPLFEGSASLPGGQVPGGGTQQ